MNSFHITAACGLKYVVRSRFLPSFLTSSCLCQSGIEAPRVKGTVVELSAAVEFIRDSKVHAECFGVFETFFSSMAKASDDMARWKCE